jgi:MYXO-CTERM domain-containing protein
MTLDPAEGGERAIPRRVFAAVAAFFVVGAAFHVVALVRPAVGDPSPPWRHALFVLINLAVALGLRRRPRGFAFGFALLTAQQLWSHGLTAALVWSDERRLDWASVLVVAGMPIVLALLVVDVRARRRREALPASRPTN